MGVQKTKAGAGRSSRSAGKHSLKFSELWQPLKPGDLIDIVAPGFRSTDQDFQGGLRFLLNLGFEVRVSKKIYGHDVLCANSDDERFEQLKAALYAKDSQAVWCMRGGYGSLRLIPRLAAMKKPKGPPKLFIGLSDITTLHIFLNQNWGWPTVHGPLLDRLGKGAALPKYEKEMKLFIRGEVPEMEFRSLRPLNQKAREKKVIRASVSGGNLIVLQSSLGTQVSWDPRGQILFFEDIGERGYRVDRVLEQFRQMGLIAKAKAVVFGQFTGGKEPDGRDLVPAVLRRFASEVSLPVLSGLECGHDKIQRPLPFATTATLNLGGSKATLICHSGCVSR